jgi:nicotinate-nucleotide adenylyltransferase
MSTPREVAVFGGSFDPPHVAHVLAVAYALATGAFERVVVIPVYAHAFDKPLSPFEHRLEMTRLAMSSLRAVEVSDVERHLPTPSRTLATLERLKRDDPGARLRLVVGADVLSETDQWHAFDRITELAPLFVLGRASVDHAGSPPSVLPDVSSTRVRALLRETEGHRIEHPELARYVPRAVLQYIDDHGLYR